MKNKPTDMQTMVDTMTLEDIEKLQKEAMSQLISSTGAMIKVTNMQKDESQKDPTPFEVLGWISANLPEPVFSCYNK